MTRRFTISGPISLELKLVVWLTLAAILSLRVAEAEVSHTAVPVGIEQSVQAGR